MNYFKGITDYGKRIVIRVKCIAIYTKDIVVFGKLNLISNKYNANYFKRIASYGKRTAIILKLCFIFVKDSTLSNNVFVLYVIGRLNFCKIYTYIIL